VKPLTTYKPIIGHDRVFGDPEAEMRRDIYGRWYAKDEADAKFAELEKRVAMLADQVVIRGRRLFELEAEREAARADAERLRAGLETARDYVASELHQERINFKGYEHASNIASIEADLALIDAAIDAARGKE
jgi:hypothetical protein